MGLRDSQIQTLEKEGDNFCFERNKGRHHHVGVGYRTAWLTARKSGKSTKEVIIEGPWFLRGGMRGLGRIRQTRGRRSNRVLTGNGQHQRERSPQQRGSQSGKAVWELVGKHPQSGKRSSDFMRWGNTDSWSWRETRSGRARQRNIILATEYRREGSGQQKLLR